MHPITPPTNKHNTTGPNASPVSLPPGATMTHMLCNPYGKPIRNIFINISSHPLTRKIMLTIKNQNAMNPIGSMVLVIKSSVVIPIRQYLPGELFKCRCRLSLRIVPIYALSGFPALLYPDGKGNSRFKNI
jgi:hypothetical protein